MYFCVNSILNTIPSGHGASRDIMLPRIGANGGHFECQIQCLIVLNVAVDFVKYVVCFVGFVISGGFTYLVMLSEY